MAHPKTAALAVVFVVVVGIVAYLYAPKSATPAITSFAECEEAGYPVAESYPRQCTTPDGKHFTEDVGNAPAKADLIRLTSPAPGATITSPLTLTGEARGNWYFEASFPINVVDWDGLIIGQGHAEAQSDWMTTDFVPFKAVITFDTSKIRGQYADRGTLILRKDNPSGLPEHDDALEIPIRFTMGSGALGTVLLGPTCPVVQDPPDPKCADKPYATKLVLTSADGARVIKEFMSDENGEFVIAADPGTYAIRGDVSHTLPYCGAEPFIISAGKYTAVAVSCDTGIR